MELDERKKQWIENAKKLDRFHHHCVPLCQWLGRLDIELIEGDNKIPNLKADEGTSGSEWLTRHQTLSYLWVLGAYELLCILKNFEDPKKDEIKEVYEYYREIRVPMAKLIRAGDGTPNLASAMDKGGDATIAIPGLNTETKMIAWRTTDDKKSITRMELSDYLFDLIVKL